MSDRNPDDSDRRDTADSRDRRDAADSDATDPGGTDPDAEERRTEPEIGGDDDPEENRRAEAEPEYEPGPGEPEHDDGDDDGAGLSGGIALLVAAAVALVVTALAYVWVGGWVGNEVFFEDLFRVAPTVQGGGVGADWVFGNTVPLLDAAIAIVHAADVLMGVAILAILFIHWAIFRRLADRMQRPVEGQAEGTVATDGGKRDTREKSSGGDDR